MVEAGIDLLDTESERGRYPEQGRHRGHDVNDVADRSVDLLSKKRVEHGANREGKALVEGEKRQRGGVKRKRKKAAGMDRVTGRE